MCGNGTYSFRFTPSATCLPCPAGAAYCYGNVIAAPSGTWRVSPASTAFKTCPFPQGCVGGALPWSVAVTNDAVANRTAGCALYYQGPLCSVCRGGAFFDQLSLTCLPCKSPAAQLQLTALIAIPLSCLAFAVLVRYLVRSRVNCAWVRDWVTKASGANPTTPAPTPAGQAAAWDDVIKGPKRITFWGEIWTNVKLYGVRLKILVARYVSTAEAC